VNQSLVSISVRVYPNAAGNEVAGFSDGVFQVKVAAPPVQGKANRELVAFLGKALGISKNRVSITRGHTTRNKLITIDGLSEADVERRLLPGT
jgi:uncharacterized protein (TIGR00251 family)